MDTSKYFVSNSVLVSSVVTLTRETVGSTRETYCVSDLWQQLAFIQQKKTTFCHRLRLCSSAVTLKNLCPQKIVKYFSEHTKRVDNFFVTNTNSQNLRILHVDTF